MKFLIVTTRNLSRHLANSFLKSLNSKAFSGRLNNLLLDLPRAYREPTNSMTWHEACEKKQPLAVEGLKSPEVRSDCYLISGLTFKDAI